MATTYIAIVDAEVDPEAPITSFLAFRFRDNPLAIAERAAGAPQVIPEILDVLTGSGNFIVPAGVTRLRITAVGGGGGGNSTTGGGGAAVIIVNLTVVPAQSIAYVVGAGGAGGAGVGSPGIDSTFGALNADSGAGAAGGGASGGIAAGGDVNLSGSDGINDTNGHGFGGASALCAGPVVEVVGEFPGGGGGGGSGANGLAGAAGTIILEY